MDIKKTTTTKIAIKKCHFEDDILIDENGEEINVNEKLQKVFQTAESFDVVATLKEDFDLEEEDFEE